MTDQPSTTERPTSGPAPLYGEYGPIVPVKKSEPVKAEIKDAPTPARLVGRSDPQAAGAAKVRPRWDFPLTLALFVIGVINVIDAGKTIGTLQQSLTESYAAMGIGKYTSTEVAHAIGVAIFVTQLVLLLVAIAVAVPRISKGKRAFWVPLGAGVIAGLATLILMVVAVVSDPALNAYLQSQGG